MNPTIEHEIDPIVYRRRWATLAVLCTSLMIVIIGNTSLNVAIPTLARELDASTSQLQWMVDAYSLVFAGLLFTAGTLGDRFGRKGALQAGLVVFLGGTILASTADAAGTVIAGRAVMGVAAAFVIDLPELGGARRIVEDEVRARLATYGADRRRDDPPDAPFVDRRLREPLELTSRVSTDAVAEAKEKLALACSDTSGVDVAMATNMISVGLDIGRLGLMLVQGQPKTASEYIQSTSRVGRRPDRPGLCMQ